MLVHNAQFVNSERAIADAYGHSTVEDVVELATELEVSTLVLFHHGPGRTDDQLDAIGAGFTGLPMDVVIAKEGAVLELGSPAVAAPED